MTANEIKNILEEKEREYHEVEAPTINQGYLKQEKATVADIFANRLRVKTRTHMFRNVIEELPDWFSRLAFGDVPLSMILGKYGKFGFIDEPMAVYRQTGKGISSVGREEKWFIRDHFYKWIKIWEIGLIHFDYKYSKEAIKTIKEFYSIILKKYKYSPQVILNIFRNNVIYSELRWNYRFKISVDLVFGILAFKPSEILRYLRNRISQIVRIVRNPVHFYCI